jgi:uncharacterized protein YnzC (UPF0291/DUF896 family)
MLERKKMDRINELARKSKTLGLCEDEKQEQYKLRQEYLSKFREVFRGHLENIEFADEPLVAEGETSEAARQKGGE